MTDLVLRAVDEIAEEMIGFLQGLTRIRTVNPPGEEYRAGAEFIGAKLREFGYETAFVIGDDDPAHSDLYPRVNVIGSQPPSALPGTRGKTLHFNGHFDVVPVGAGWTVDPFGAEILDGKLYGRGTCDQKAGIAASIFAVEALRRAGVKLLGTVEQSATVDEESGGFAGVACLARRGYIARERTDYVIITEPSNVDRVCIGHRGVYWFKVIQHGRIGHGSMPFLGVSAADHLGEMIHAVKHRLKPRLAERVTGMPVEPPGSRHACININSVFGGQPEHAPQTPCVVDRAGAIFDRRFLPEENFEDVRGEVVDLLDSLGTPYTLEDLMTVYPTHTDPQSILVQTVAAKIQVVLGKPAPLMASPGTYDHKHVNRIGNVVDCIAYGPGILDLAHQPDEYVLVADVIRAAKVMALATMDLLGTDSLEATAS